MAELVDVFYVVVAVQTWILAAATGWFFAVLIALSRHILC